MTLHNGCYGRPGLKQSKNVMKNFLDEDFLLHTEAARRLYHEYAREMPVIDYHCHLPRNR